MQINPLSLRDRATVRGSQQMISQLLKWIGIVIGVLILAVVLFLAFFDLNRLRGPLSTMVSDKLERPFAIRGDLDVAWSWTPKITINEIEPDKPTTN